MNQEDLNEKAFYQKVKEKANRKYGSYKTFNQKINGDFEFNATRPTYNAETLDTKDNLDIMDEVEALSRLIMSRDVSPPLSIGIFGDWGSGKSFFMKKLQKEIDHLKGKVNDPYFDNITQITFNAWHFMDTNLWASITSNIFDKIGEETNIQPQEEEAKRKEKEDLFQQLASTKGIVEKIKNDISELEAQQQLIQASIQQKTLDIEARQGKIEQLKTKDIIQIFRENEKVQTLINSAEKQLDEQIKQQNGGFGIEDVKKTYEEYNSLLGRTKIFYKWLKGLKPLQIVIYTLLLIIPFVIGDIISFFSNNNLFANTSTAFGAVISFFTFAVQIFRSAIPYLEKVNAGLDNLEKAQQEFEQIKSDNELALEVLEQQQQLLLQEKLEAESELKNAEILIQETNDKLKNLDIGQEFSSFIEDRIDSVDYKQHLGLISTIRQDFEQLTKFLHNFKDENNVPSSKIETKSTNSQNKIDRIILYIDDLDRCPEEKVIEVLQAIHLLLSFELFVVVVGIDIRWVTKSLRKEYGILLSHIGDDALNKIESHNRLDGYTSPFDYLEKIFQIPFRLKQISDPDKKNYIEALIKKEEAFVEKTPIEISETKIQTEVNLEADLEFMKNLSPILGHSPRSIKRYVNTVRLIKSNPAWIPMTNENGDLPYNAVFFLLGVIIGSPSLAHQLFNWVKHENNPEKSISELFQDHMESIETSNDKSMQEWKIFHHFLMQARQHESLNIKSIPTLTVRELQLIIPFVKRFAFRDY